MEKKADNGKNGERMGLHFMGVCWDLQREGEEQSVGEYLTWMVAE